MPVVNWGIVGCGWAAGDFAEGLRSVPDARLAAVCARRSAAAFAERFGVPHHYDSVSGLVGDGDVDVVYVATPNSLHAEQCLAALEAGKPVLCEKPFAMSAAEARRVVDAARARSLFCMEAMWMRFVPGTRRACELIQQGAIGEVRTISASFGHQPPYDPDSRYFNPSLGGGALLDVGVYGLSLAVMLLGSPLRVSSDAVITPSGVDAQSVAVLTYGNGATAVVSASLSSHLPAEAVISGSEGELRLAPLYRPERLTLSRAGEPAPGEHVPFEGNGFNYEAVETMRCLGAGLGESPLMSLDDTLATMETLDTARSQWPPASPS